MRKYGFWKDLTFYFLIEAYADVILRAAGEFQELGTDPQRIVDKLQTFADLRNEADEVHNQFIQRLDHAFITPLDKEDLLELLQQLEMIQEAIERAAHGLTFVTAEGTTEHLPAFVAKLQETVQAAFELASSLRHGAKHQDLPANLAALHRIKKESNLLHDAVLRDLGAQICVNPLLAFNCKEAYDRFLQVPEKTTDLARLVARMLVKYA